jgi:hypothetical protein
VFRYPIPPLFTMAGRASLTAKNLEALGTALLAGMLVRHEMCSAAARRALRFAGTVGRVGLRWERLNRSRTPSAPQS